MSGSFTYEWDKDGDGSFSEDISGYVLSCDIRRGRRTDLGRMPAGSATLVLNNHDGRFSPDKAAGPYYGQLNLYRRLRIKGTVVGASTYGMIYMYVLGMSNKPKIKQQVVTWFLGDKFALWQDKKLNLLFMRQLPVKCALDLAVNRAAGDNECTNPSVEKDLTGYSALQGVTPARDATMKIEGDYTVRCDCPGTNAGEGLRYDATGQVSTGKPIIARIWVRASETVNLVFRAYDSVIGELRRATVSVGSTPTLLEIYGLTLKFQPGSSHYFELYTEGATEVMFWADGLYFTTPESTGELFWRDLDDGTAEIELAASYRQPALEILQAIAESEPRSFFFTYCDKNSPYFERLRFRDKDWRATAIAAGPVATFSDDGADVPYFDVVYREDAKDRISEAEVTSQGDYSDENELSRIWELSPVPYTVPGGDSLEFHIPYSQPARDCVLTVNDPDSSPVVFYQGAEDGYIRRIGLTYPPAGPGMTFGDSYLWVGQQLSLGPAYHSYRSYLRFNTAAIPDDATITKVRLVLRAKINYSDQDFTIQVRDKSWGPTLGTDDWDGTGTIRGTFNTVGFPAAGNKFPIDIAIAAVNKTGYTEFELTSDREIAGTEPTGKERVAVSSQEGGWAPQLIVTYGISFSSIEFENYGVGAYVKATTPAGTPIDVEYMYIEGIPLQASSEESKVIKASVSPPPVDRTLFLALPLQGTRTASMEAEATRLANRYDIDAPPKRISLTLRPKSDAVLTQMLTREIGELIHVENINDPFSSFIDANFWIEGIRHRLRPGGLLETTFDLEEQ